MLVNRFCHATVGKKNDPLGFKIGYKSGSGARKISGSVIIGIMWDASALHIRVEGMNHLRLQHNVACSSVNAIVSYQMQKMLTNHRPAMFS